MNSFNISVKAKLYSTLALSAFILIGVGVVGLTGTKSSNTDLDAIFSNRFMPTGWVGEMESRDRDLLTHAEDAVIRQDVAAIKAALEDSNDREVVDKGQHFGAVAAEVVGDLPLLAGELGGLQLAPQPLDLDFAIV